MRCGVERDQRVELPDRIVEALSLAGALEGLEDKEWRLIQEVCNA